VPYFLVRVKGEGIAFEMKGSPKQAIGFFTTRLVHAADSHEASDIAIQRVLMEWLPEGQYATGNRGGFPRLSVEDAWRVGWLRGAFGRKPRGYSFFLRE